MTLQVTRRRYALLTFVVLSILLIGVYRLHETPAPPLDPKYGRIAEVKSDSKLAIVTYLTGGLLGDDDEVDEYFEAVRTLAYQLLHDPITKIHDERVTFVVLASMKVRDWKLDILRREGVSVVRTEDVATPWWIHTKTRRWKDQFNKLTVLRWTNYSRVLFLDADMLLTSALDKVFSEPEIINPINTLTDTILEPTRKHKSDEGLLPAQYLFAARSDHGFAGQRNHAFPPLQTSQFSAGFWVAAPSEELYIHLTSIMKHYRRFDPFTMEQSLLNYAFRRDGPMPWRELHYRWVATWASESDLKNGVVALHEKFWRTGPEKLAEVWREKNSAMREYWNHKAAGPL